MVSHNLPLEAKLTIEEYKPNGDYCECVSIAISILTNGMTFSDMNMDRGINQIAVPICSVQYDIRSDPPFLVFWERSQTQWEKARRFATLDAAKEYVFKQINVSESSLKKDTQQV